MSSSAETLVQKLLNPSNYPHQTAENIKVIETHISFVFLTGDYVYKVKKAIKFGDVLDYSTLEKRKYYCSEEIRLNRRLAPELYLDVAKIDENGKVDGNGRAIEYATKMKQLPQELLLKTYLLKHKSQADMIVKSIAKSIAEFHKKNVVRPNYSYYESIYEKWDENFRTTKHYPKFPFDNELKQRVFKFLENKKAFFNQRIKEGKIVDGHGDLITANIFWYEGKPLIFDCIEFNPMLRIQDQLEEICFLGMDLDFLGLKKESKAFIEHYLSLMNATEILSENYVEFFKSYRAYVRAKVYYSQYLQSNALEQEKVRELALKYLHLSRSYQF